MHEIPPDEKQLEIDKLCYEIAAEAHTGQTRWNGDPYIYHPTRIANKFKGFKSNEYQDVIRASNESRVAEWGPLGFNNYLYTSVAYLHDVLEDCEGYTPSVLLQKGVPHEIVWAVIILTKLEEEKYLPYLLRVKNSGNEIAKVVKLFDIEDNLSDLSNYDKSGKRIDRYEMALHILKN